MGRSSLLSSRGQIGRGSSAVPGRSGDRQLLEVFPQAGLAQVLALAQSYAAASPAPAPAAPASAPQADPAPAQPAPAQAAPATSSDSGGANWSAIAACESGGNWSTDTGNGFYGGLQFTEQTWLAYGGGQYASSPNLASESQQIAVAQQVLAGQGIGAWPVCGAGG